MNRDATGPALSAIFVDYDNIYMSLKRRSEEAAKRFSKDAGLWIKELESGRLITPTSAFTAAGQRRIVMNRCYGNPMPRRNASDNSTDMNSFPFVRHHFLRAGSEVIDCPPLTAQLKNSADIRIVMDVRDMITHDTYFDEFIILSGDADFTPLLHRLRAHARRTVIFANDHTAQPYTAISDGEVREQDLLRLLLEGSLDTPLLADGETSSQTQLPRPSLDMAGLRRELIGEIVMLVRSAGQPVPLEALADRLVRQLGHEKTAGSGWGGTGGFRELLSANLPEEFRLSEQAPFVVFELARMLPSEPTARSEPQRLDRLPPAVQRAMTAGAPSGLPARTAESDAPMAPQTQAAAPIAAESGPLQPTARAQPPQAAQRSQSPALPSQQPQRSAPPTGMEAPSPKVQPTALQPQSAPMSTSTASTATAPTTRTQVSTQALAIQQAVARIYEACQAPPLSPPEYRAVFEVMAQEINTRGLTGAPTLDNIASRAKDFGVDIRRDDVRFLLDVVSESDPWFEQGASLNLFASRFRNFVVARCRSHGLALTVDELDLIEHWFAGATTLPAPQQAAPIAPQQRALTPPAAQPPQVQPASAAPAERWWSMEQHSAGEPVGNTPPGGDDFPRIIRTRMRG